MRLYQLVIILLLQTYLTFGAKEHSKGFEDSDDLVFDVDLDFDKEWDKMKAEESLNMEQPEVASEVKDPEESKIDNDMSFLEDPFFQDDEYSLDGEPTDDLNDLLAIYEDNDKVDATGDDEDPKEEPMDDHLDKLIDELSGKKDDNPEDLEASLKDEGGNGWFRFLYIQRQVITIQVQPESPQEPSEDDEDLFGLWKSLGGRNFEENPRGQGEREEGEEVTDRELLGILMYFSAMKREQLGMAIFYLLVMVLGIVGVCSLVVTVLKVLDSAITLSRCESNDDIIQNCVDFEDNPPEYHLIVSEEVKVKPEMDKKYFLIRDEDVSVV